MKQFVICSAIGIHHDRMKLSTSEHHPDVVLPASLHAPSGPGDGHGSSSSDREWKSAKTCFHRKGYPSSISPPLEALEEAERKYGITVSAGVINESLQGGGDDGSSQEPATNSARDEGQTKLESSQSVSNPQQLSQGMFQGHRHASYA